jgi:hypothetical protein
MIKSKFKKLERLTLPLFSGVRVQMMPLDFANPHLIPESLQHYLPTIQKLIDMSDYKSGIGYITIDEKFVKAGTSHRRPGIHVDDYSWGGGSGGGTVWGSRGMLLVSNVIGCKAWSQNVVGRPGKDGDCSHLAPQLKEENSILLEPNHVYWLDEKEHYAEVMFNKTFDRLTKEEKKNLKSYYEAENQYLETIKKYGESEISQGVKRLYSV